MHSQFYPLSFQKVLGAPASSQRCDGTLGWVLYTFSTHFSPVFALRSGMFSNYVVHSPMSQKEKKNGNGKFLTKS